MTTTEHLIRIGQLAVTAHTLKREAEELEERAEAEGWDNDPTGSGHVNDAWRTYGEAAAEMEEAIEELTP